MYQLVLEDEYGQRSIVFSSDDLNKVVNKAKQEVADENMSNALTLDEQKRDFTAYLPVWVDENGEVNEFVVYAGRKGATKMALVVDENGDDTEVPVTDIDLTPQFYIGEFVKDKKNGVVDVMYAEDAKRKIVTAFNHQQLQSKTVYFVKKV